MDDMSEGRWVELTEAQSAAVSRTLFGVGAAAAGFAVAAGELDDVDATTRTLARVLAHATEDGPARLMIRSLLEGIKHGLDASDPSRN